MTRDQWRSKVKAEAAERYSERNRNVLKLLAEGYTMEAAGQAQEPPITRQRVEQIRRQYGPKRRRRVA